MDARRRAAARVRSVARDIRAALQARSSARRNRLYSAAEGDSDLLGEALMEAEAGGPEGLEVALLDTLKDLLGLADAIRQVAASAAAEGPVVGPPHAERGSDAYWLGWSKQLDLACDTAATLVKELYHCGALEQQGRVLQAAAAIMQAAAAASTAMLQQAAPLDADLEMEELKGRAVDESLARVCKLATAVLSVCNDRYGESSQGRQAAAACEAALAGPLSPDALLHFWHTLTPAFDLAVQRRGLAACVFTAQLCQLVAQTQPCDRRMLPYRHALLDDWPLAEGLVRLLAAAHSSLLGTRFWEASRLEDNELHSGLGAVLRFWEMLLARTHETGQQPRAAALLLEQAEPLFLGEMEALSSLPLEAANDAVLQACWSTTIRNAGMLASFLVSPALGCSVQPVQQQLATAAPHVLRYCCSCLPARHRSYMLCKSLEAWLSACKQACQTASQQAADAPELQPEQRQQQGAAAASLATSLLRLARQLPQLQRTLDGCSGAPDCTCLWCGNGGRRGFHPRFRDDKGHTLMCATHAALDSCNKLLSPEWCPVTPLTRLHSACASLCHFLAGLDSRTLEECFAQPPPPRAAADASSTGADQQQHAMKVLDSAHLLLTTTADAAFAALRASKPADAGGDAAHQWDRAYTCAVLEVAAAAAALNQAGGIPKLSRDPHGARHLLLQYIAVTARGGDLSVISPDDAALLAALTAPLWDPAAAPRLAVLVQRQLPEQSAADSSQAAAAAPPPPPMEAAVLQAEALATRRVCSHLACPNLADPGTSHAASKKCARCRRVRYCGTACQHADWRAQHHKLACKALQPAPDGAGAGASAPASASPLSSAPGSSPASKGGCTMCRDAPKNALCIPCGHRALCSGCARSFVSSGCGDCPECRTKLAGFYLTDEQTSITILS